MGYSQTIPFAIQEIRSSNNNPETFAIAPNTGNVTNIFIPTIKSPLTYAYLDLIIQDWRDTSGALNYLDGGEFGLKDTGGTFHASNSLTDTLHIEANTRRMGDYRIPGFNNLVSYITPGATQDVAVSVATAHGNSLVIENLYGELRLYYM